MSTPVLSGRDLVVRLGGRPVLDSVSVDVAPGRIHALLGPNGAGKTTLLRSLQGLVRRESGTVEATGVLGYVPQRHDIDWDFPVTAKDVVLLGLVRSLGMLRPPRRAHLEAVARALGRVRMTDLRDRPIGEMSGGQRQRVMIARALVRDPSVLLLDEPFTGLDMPSQELLSDLFRDLAASGCAVVMSTHDLTHALDIADDVTLLNRTVIASGPPSQLRDADAWQRTFEVGPRSPLLTQVGALTDDHPHADHHLAASSRRSADPLTADPARVASTSKDSSSC